MGHSSPSSESELPSHSASISARINAPHRSHAELWLTNWAGESVATWRLFSSRYLHTFGAPRKEDQSERPTGVAFMGLSIARGVPIRGMQKPRGISPGVGLSVTIVTLFVTD